MNKGAGSPGAKVRMVSRRNGPRRRKCRFVVLEALLLYVAVATCVGATPEQRVSREKLCALAAQVVAAGDVKVVQPSVRVETDTVNAAVAEAQMPWWGGHGVTPYEIPLARQIEVDAYRGRLFRRMENKAFMEPYFKQMDAVIDEQLDNVSSAGGRSNAGLTKKLQKLDGKMQQILVDGVKAWATANGRKNVTWVAPAVPCAKVRLEAADGAQIEVLPRTSYLLLNVSGRDENDLPWRSYSNGEVACLLGTYQIRVLLRGKVVSQVKEVVAETEKLMLTSP